VASAARLRAWRVSPRSIAWIGLPLAHEGRIPRPAPARSSRNGIAEGRYSA
jgi:hypothetical protein